MARKTSVQRVQERAVRLKGIRKARRKIIRRKTKGIGNIAKGTAKGLASFPFGFVSTRSRGGVPGAHRIGSGLLTSGLRDIDIGVRQLKRKRKKSGLGKILRRIRRRRK